MFTCEFRKRRNRTGLYWTPCTINRIEDKTVKAKKKKKKKKYFKEQNRVIPEQPSNS